MCNGDSCLNYENGVGLYVCYKLQTCHLLTNVTDMIQTQKEEETLTGAAKMSFKCHRVICLPSSGVFLLKRVLHHQNRKDVLGNNNGNPKDFIFPTKRLHLLVYISMPVICLQWKAELLFL